LSIANKDELLVQMLIKEGKGVYGKTMYLFVSFGLRFLAESQVYLEKLAISQIFQRYKLIVLVIK